MGIKNDFSRAMKELFSKPEDENMQASEATGQIEAVDETVVAAMRQPDYQFAGERMDADFEAHVPFRSSEGSVISSQTKIQGDIESVDSIEIAGEVQGEIVSKSDVEVAGKIHGDITAAKIKANGSTIRGNIHSKTEVFVSEQTKIKGDISARSAQLKGIVEGNISTGEELVIGEGAVIDGDICTTNLEIKKGAIINSKITMNKPSL